MAKSKEPKARLDVFALLGEIDRENTKYLETLPEEIRKTFSAYVTMLWIRGASSNRDAHIVLTNELVNPYVFSLGKHPILLYKLLVAANGYGEKTYYKFIKNETKHNTEHLNAIMLKYNYSKREALDALKMFTESELDEMVDSLGIVKK